jgi:hypothetical protein
MDECYYVLTTTMTNAVDLKSRLVSMPPRDLSGATSSDRFSYQQHWALCHLLELHVSGQDYVVVFDHHEDVMVLDSESEPSSISGYQIKTKDGSNFTIKNLLKREAGTGDPPNLLPSILGKLYDLRVRFPEVKLLSIVSNASITVKLACDGKTHYHQEQTSFDELHADAKQVITEGLKSEAKSQDAPKLSGLLEFRKAELPLRKHDTYSRGKLSEFLQQLFPDKEFRIIPLYRSLLSEVVVRNNRKEAIDTFEDLLRHKSLSRTSFEDVLKQAGVSESTVGFDEVAQRLNSEGCPFDLLSGVRREWDAVRLDRLAGRDLPKLRLQEALKLAVDKYQSETRLLDLMEKVFHDVRSKARREWAFSDIYLKTAAIIEAYERK